MQLWTIQSVARWERLQRSGVLNATRMDETYYRRVAYSWMIEQLARRVGPPPEGCHYPIWAWYQWNGKSHKRPDLRASDYRKPDEPLVRLELEVPDANVLLSDFLTWHMPLNTWVLSRTMEKMEQFEQELESAGFNFGNGGVEKALADTRFGPRIQEGWELIFDLDFENPDLTETRQDKRIQAVFWQLHLDQVRKVDFIRWSTFRRPGGSA